MSMLDMQAFPDLPDLDDRLVESESPYEMYDGELVRVSPADPPHALRQFKLSAVIGPCLKPEFCGATEMLTRTSKTHDIAPDVSVLPRAPHPVTGGRQLEHLTFEVVSTQTLANAGRKAALLIARGVRRVFAIDVERGRALEWSRELEGWGLLDSSAVIEDPVFAVPLPIKALLNPSAPHDTMADALIAQRNPRIEAVRAQEHDLGRAAGKSESLLALLAARDLVLTASEHRRIVDERDPARLDRWILCAVTCASVADVLAIG